MEEHRDRRGLLIAAGIFEIVMGFGSLSMAGFMVLAFFMTSRNAPGMDAKAMVPGMLLYVMAGAAFIAMGIGSIRCRRWARALWLILGWGWLAVGIVSISVLAVILPSVLEMTGEKTPPGMRVAMAALIIGISIFFYILIPLTIVLIYRSPHVKATCEAQDPKPGWTDRCPLPVLALALFMGLWGVWVVPGVAVMPVLPAFGTYLTGWKAVACAVGAALACLYVARAAYRRQWLGWWGAVALMVLFMASAYITFATAGVEEMYRLLETPEEQLEMMKQTGVMEWVDSPWLILVGAAPLVGFLVWVRRYFTGADATRS